MSFRWLKRLGDWLDNRFPAKVHVTDEVFQALLKRETERTQRANTQEAELAALTGLLARQGAALAELKGRMESADALDGRLIVQLSDEQKRIDALEGTIGAIKEFVTKAAAPDAQAAARRAAFIASGRMPE